jgi:hypothetical protein
MPLEYAEILMRALLATTRISDVRHILDSIGDHANVEFDVPYYSWRKMAIRGNWRVDSPFPSTRSSARDRAGRHVIVREPQSCRAA